MSIIIIPRAGWGAVSPKSRYSIPTPTPRLWLHHTAGSGANEATVRAIQKFHMNPPPAGRGWSDIAYSFLVDNDDPDIDIFEGRGVGIAGGHTKGDNTQSHAICVIGNFTTKPPADLTLQRVAELIAHGYDGGWWPLGFTGGHRDAPGAATTCPGNALHKLIPEINSEARRIYAAEPPAPEVPDTMFSLKRVHAYKNGDGTQRSDIAYICGRIRTGWGLTTATIPPDGSWPPSLVTFVKTELSNAGNTGDQITGNDGHLIEDRASRAAATGNTGPYLELADWQAWRKKVATALD